MGDFIPAPHLVGGHRMTIYTWARPRIFPNLQNPQPRYFDVASDARVLAHCHWQPAPRQRATLVALHGLEGSSQAHYMQGLADKAFAWGFNVVLLNQRNCGGTEHLSQGLYHSGLSADPVAVIRELIELDGLRSIAIVGYSLGGNVATSARGSLRWRCLQPRLEPSAQFHQRWIWPVASTHSNGPANAAYEWNFVRNLKRRMRRKARALPGRFDLRSTGGSPDCEGLRRGVHCTLPRVSRCRRLLPPSQQSPCR